jgi:hypothetical protein
MFSGNRAEIGALWIVAIGFVVALVGLIGVYSERAVFLHVFHSVTGSAAFAAVGLVLMMRGAWMHRAAKIARERAQREIGE